MHKAAYVTYVSRTQVEIDRIQARSARLRRGLLATDSVAAASLLDVPDERAGRVHEDSSVPTASNGCVCVMCVPCCVCICTSIHHPSIHPTYMHACMRTYIRTSVDGGTASGEWNGEGSGGAREARAEEEEASAKERVALQACMCKSMPARVNACDTWATFMLCSSGVSAEQIETRNRGVSDA